MSKEILLERDIKSLTLNNLIRQGKINSSSVIINEYTIDNFSRRSDLAIIAGNTFIAIEIKSEVDSLHRLDDQTKKYLDYFDKVIIVSVKKHIKKITELSAGNVEIWEIVDNTIKIIKRGRIKKTSDKTKYLDLLKKEELLKLSKKINLREVRGSKKKIKDILKEETEKVSQTYLRDFTLNTIKHRFNLTSSLFYKKVTSAGVVTPEDILLLSPYALDRRANEKAKALKKSILENLKARQEEDPFLAKLATDSNLPIFGETPDSINKIITD